MKREIADITIGLIQARTSPRILQQEQDCFAERIELRHDQIMAVNMIDQIPDDSMLDQIDVLMIGGSGEFPAAADYRWMPPLLGMVNTCKQRGFPLFGSCWGHQVIARALGGQVIHDQACAELGCHSVFLTEDGKIDSLIGQFPERFDANMGHHDRVNQLPLGAVELARSRTQGNQIFRIENYPIYGTQFHSELDSHREAERLHEYREQYSASYSSDEEFQFILDSLRETTEVDHLMRTFVDHYVLSRE